MRRNKGRKGFTLIELMIVIAIIIILAAVAIPNYLRMTDRARRSRVAGDISALATAFEAYKVDWGEYPANDGEEYLIMKDEIDTLVEQEITGIDATKNKADEYTLTGEEGPIEYIKAGTVQGMFNPYDPDDGYYYYCTKEASGEDHWHVYVLLPNGNKLGRSDVQTELREETAGGE